MAKYFCFVSGVEFSRIELKCSEFPHCKITISEKNITISVKRYHVTFNHIYLAQSQLSGFRSRSLHLVHMLIDQWVVGLDKCGHNTVFNLDRAPNLSAEPTDTADWGYIYEPWSYQMTHLPEPWKLCAQKAGALRNIVEFKHLHIGEYFRLLYGTANPS